jgi:hypothetical protein
MILFSVWFLVDGEMPHDDDANKYLIMCSTIFDVELDDGGMAVSIINKIK